MNIRQFFWTLPFLSFILGYKALGLFISGPTIEVPTVLGKSTNEALVVTSNNNLGIKIIGEKEDPDIPEGTILYQTPINQKVKRNQSIYVVISKKPPNPLIPNLLTKPEQDIDKILNKHKIKAKKYYLANCPQFCLGQYPSPGQEITKEKAILYLGSTTPKPCLFPNLKGEDVSQVIDFLRLHNLNVKIYKHGNEIEDYKPSSVVVKQKPLPGSIINLKNITTALIEIN